jgi:hypothetical protein
MLPFSNAGTGSAPGHPVINYRTTRLTDSAEEVEGTFFGFEIIDHFNGMQFANTIMTGLRTLFLAGW